MYAVFQVGGRQYRAAEGDKVRVERLPQAVGDRVEFDQVLLVADGSETTIGKPTVKGAKVVTQVVEQSKGKKLIVFKYRPGAKRQRTKSGHRQNYTWLEVEEIVAGR